MCKGPHQPEVEEVHEGPRLLEVDKVRKGLLLPGAAVVDELHEESEVPVPGEPARPEGEGCNGPAKPEVTTTPTVLRPPATWPISRPAFPAPLDPQAAT